MDINDNLFVQAISCPLKLYHSSVNKDFRKNDLPFKHRNKLQLRDTISIRFNHRKFTSDDTLVAIRETEIWIKEENVTICGAVIQSDNLLSRIPILVKNGDEFTIIQVHGKLRKRSDSSEIHSVPKKRTTSLYLLKAAYRAEIVRRLFPKAIIKVEFYFPQRGYKASVDQLLQKINRMNTDPVIVKECDQLFAKVEATKGVNDILKSVPATISHKIFAGRSVSEICDQLQSTDWTKGNQLNVKVNQSCKYCDFRKNENLEKNGCWNQFFFDEEITEPGRHVFELIGHGNEVDSDNGYHYQEQIPYADQFSSFEIVEKYSGPKITIQQRRVLQLLKAKGEKIPKLWAKQEIKEINNLEYPLHFIDFEAATYAIPMKRGNGPYSPVYFQFSCHSLYKNGDVEHFGWLDSDPESGYPHSSFVRELYNIPHINCGTLIQYSQFEQQALRSLATEFNRNAMLYESELSMLKELLLEHKSGSPRFLDLSRLVRDTYFNTFLEGSLGLKQVLKSVLRFQKSADPIRSQIVKIADVEIDLFEDYPEENNPDPYKSAQDHRYAIDDGASAMNAYISLKSNLLTLDEAAHLPNLLKRYCALDSFALIVIFNHLKSLIEKMDQEKDLIIF